MDLDRLTPDQLFREFLRARNRGDWERAGDAFELIAMLTYPDIRAFHSRKMSYGRGKFSDEDIEDVTQATLEKMVTHSTRSARSFRGTSRAQLGAFLFQIAANVRNDWMEKGYRRDRIAPTRSLQDGGGDEERELPAGGWDIPDIEEGYADLETREIVLGLLSDLSDSHRRIVAMKLYEHAPSREISEETGDSVANVDKVFSRFMQKLRDRFVEADQAGNDGSGGNNMPEAS